jgi:AcrR family transcriptional regulator
MASSTKARSRAEPTASTREQLLETAERLFLEKGLRATSVHEIAAEAGFTTGALYWNFASKDALFLELLERHLADTYEKFQELGLDRLGEVHDPAATLGAALQSAEQQPAWIACLFEFVSYAARDPELQERVMSVCGKYDIAFREAFTKLFSGSSLPPERLAFAFNALMNGLWFYEFFFPKRSDMTVFAEVAKIFLATREQAK